MKRCALGLVLALASCAPTQQPAPATPAAATGAEDVTEVPSTSVPDKPVVPSKHVTKKGDRDGDGIVDDLDKCPDDPEDRDGFQDDDGCPDIDNDQDGVADVDDKCPNEPGPKGGCP